MAEGARARPGLANLRKITCPFLLQVTAGKVAHALRFFPFPAPWFLCSRLRPFHNLSLHLPDACDSNSGVQPTFSLSLSLLPGPAPNRRSGKIRQPASTSRPRLAVVLLSSCCTGRHISSSSLWLPSSPPVSPVHLGPTHAFIPACPPPPSVTFTTTTISPFVFVPLPCFTPVLYPGVCLQPLHRNFPILFLYLGWSR